MKYSEERGLSDGEYIFFWWTNQASYFIFFALRKPNLKRNRIGFFY